VFIQVYLAAVVATVILFNIPSIYVINNAGEDIKEEQVESVPTPVEVEKYIRSTARELRIDEYTFVEVARLESGGFNVLAFNPKDVDGKPKFGLFQFGTSTFDFYKHKYGVDFFNIKKWEDQVHLAAKMWKEGIEQYHWGTFIEVVRMK
jgi:hypothetical protein